MTPDPSAGTAELHAALMQALSDQYRAGVYLAVYERPGATIAQVAARTGRSARAVRHQIERLVEAGLLVVAAETPRRNTRERHYRVTMIRPFIDASDDGTLTEEERRHIPLAILRQIFADIGLAVRSGSFSGKHGHSEVRVPGEVDRRGRSELCEILRRTTQEMEGVFVRSAARLEEAGEDGVEVIATMMLFEGPTWAEPDGARRGPRPSPWLARAAEERTGSRPATSAQRRREEKR
jgi:DNA-binding transcriptional ArsR family regulator